MNSPKRLRELGADDFERMLLASATEDQGSAEALQRVLRDMQATRLATTPACEQAGRRQWVASKVSVAVKVVALAATATLLIMLGPQRHTQDSREALPAAAPAKSTSQVKPPPAPALEPVPATTEITAQPIVAPKPSVSARSKRKRSSHRAPAAAPEPSPPSPAAVPPSAPSEAQLLDDALRSLRAHDPQTSLARLDAYDRAFPRGTLRVEAAVVRARALVLAGERERAAVFAADFLATHAVDPKSVSGRALGAFCNKP